jgi:uncharacterized membrane protein YfcA
MEWYFYPVLIIAGMLAGFINTLAGSGSLITLPLLIFMGLPANVANATNRIGIFLQSAVGAASFRQQKIFDYKEGVWFAIPATFGSLAGAIAAVNLSSDLMETIIGGLLFFMFFIVLYKPEKWIQEKAGKIEGRPKLWQIVIFFFIGLYGGFIQAGVGFILLAGLVFGAGLNLTKANALKVFIVFVYTSIALLVFIVNRQINYLAGFTLAFGSMIGAFIASKVAIKSGPKVVRIILLVILLISALKYIGAIDFVVRIFSGN